MTFFQLARRNAWRKPGRTVLLIVSVAVAFVIFVVLQSFLAGAHGSAGDKDRLILSNQASAGQSLPLRYLGQIEAMEGVDAVAYSARIRGFVETENNVAVASAVDPRRALAVFGEELALTPDHVAALEGERDAAIVGVMLARSMGWQVGDRVTITAQNAARAGGDANWTFRIAGLFEGRDSSVDTYFALVNYSYIDAARAKGQGMVDGFIIVPAAGTEAQALAPQLDALFANSTHPTRTQPEKQFLQAFMRQIADLNAVVGMVVSAALVTIFMIVVNTMAFAVRERTFEIGVLKTLGLSRGRIMSLILSESLLVFAIGGTIGIIAGWLLCQIADPSIGLVFSGFVALTAALLMLGLGLLSGLLPAINAMRLPIVQTFQTR